MVCHYAWLYLVLYAIVIQWAAIQCGRLKRDLNITLDTPQFALIQDAAAVALQYVEDVRMAATCDGGTSNTLNVLFDNSEWRPQANAAVRLSNLLTKTWQITNGTGGYIDDPFLYAMTRTTIEIEALAFGSAIAFEPYLYRNMSKFCAYSFHTGNETIRSHDISVEYDYFPSEWYNGAKLKYKNLTETRASNVTQRLSEYDVNGTKVHKPFTNFLEPRMEYDDGFWTRPYFDCGGGNIWMITFNSPILATINGTMDFAGVATVDVALNILDIDQCDPADGAKKAALNVFQGTHHCKPSTQCVPRSGFGFRRGTYYCYCRPGYYYPNSSDMVQAFSGFDVETAYSDWITRGLGGYLSNYDCLPCPEGCDSCVDATPCMAEWDWVFRSLMLVIVLLTFCFAVLSLGFVCFYHNHPVIMASGLMFLKTVCLGGMIATITDLVLFPRATIASCTCRLWFEHVGFALIYCPLVFKNWRASKGFSQSGAKTTQPADVVVLRHLITLVTAVILYLAAWTAMSLPEVIMVRTGQGLKFYLCQDSWMGNGVTIAEGLFLAWAVYICFKIRNIVTDFHEAKFISWIIYLTFILKHLLLVTRVYNIGRVGPDVLYLIYVLELQIPVTCTFVILFGTKFHLIRTSVATSNSNTLELVSESGMSADARPSHHQSFAAKLEQHAMATARTPSHRESVVSTNQSREYI